MHPCIVEMTAITVLWKKSLKERAGKSRGYSQQGQSSMMVLTEFPGGSFVAKSCTSKNKLCMLSDTQIQLLKKGKIQGHFLTSQGRTLKRELDHFKFSKFIFILKHITVGLNKLDIKVAEIHSVIYLPIGTVIKCIHLYLDSYVYSPTKSKAWYFAIAGARRPAWKHRI